MIDDARANASASLERDERVVDDQRRRLVADSPHDAANDGGVLGAIHAGDAEADDGRHLGLRRQGLLHDVVEHLLDFEFAERRQVRARPSSRRADTSILVCQQTDRLGAARVDAKYNHSKGAR